MRWTNCLVGLAALALAGCSEAAEPRRSVDAAANEFRLSASPGRGGGRCAPGERRLDLGDGRAAYLRVNGRTRARRPLLLALHGAGSGGPGGLYAFRGGWEEPGLVMVAPIAQGVTWSAFGGRDRDLETLDRALRRAFARCRVDPRRVGVGGFSDGATYALTLGLANGGLFHSVIALSPGGVLTETRVGRPRVFVAHGTVDRVLPKSRTSDVIVRELRDAGYRVTYVQFRGGHKVPDAVSQRAVRWFTGR